MSEPSDQRATVSGPTVGARGWRNWAGDQSCLPGELVAPSTVEEVCEAIARAGERRAHLRVAGAGHSFSDVVCTGGVLMSLERLGRVLDVDRSSGLVRVQAGITIRRLNAELARHGLAMENLGDIDAQTIAGAISTSTHGTGATFPNIPAQVAGLKLALADGSLLDLSADDDQEAFRAARVGLGALGILVEVTVRCVPAFTLRGVNGQEDLEDTLNRFEELVQSNEHFEMFVFPHAHQAITRANNTTAQPPGPPGRVALYLDDILMTNHVFGLCCRLGRRAPSLIPAINRLVTKAAGSRVRIDRSDRVFCSPRLVRFTEMEYALPRAHTPRAVREVMELVRTSRLAVPFPIEVRTSAADDAFLSTAAGRETGYVAVHMFEGMEFEPYFRAVEEIMDALGGRPHWGKRHFQTSDTLRGRYPEWDRFAEVRARLDPEGVFSNAWTDRVLGPVRPSGRAGGGGADEGGGGGTGEAGGGGTGEAGGGGTGEAGGGGAGEGGGRAAGGGGG